MKLDPRHLESLFYYGRFELQHKRASVAVDVLTKCVDIAPTAEAFLARAVAYQDLDQADRAAADMSQVGQVVAKQPFLVCGF